MGRQLKYLVGLVSLVGACTFVISCVASRSRSRTPSAADNYLFGNSSQTKTSDFSGDPRYSAAKEFDQWLRGKLSANESERIVSTCQKNQSYSSFCYLILNKKELESRSLRANPPAKRISRRTLLTRIKNSKILNWNDLRTSPVMSSLRGLSRLKPHEIDILKAQALTETKCPNNIAVSLAAFLEDELPSKSSYETLGELYRKGGACPTEDPSDSETLMTRAGLMFFAGKQLDKAEECFKISNTEKKAFRSRALYWLSKIYDEKGNRSASRQVLEELRSSYPFSFHNLMALTSKGEDPGSVLERAEPNSLSRSQQAPQLNRLIEQVELLNQFGLHDSADKVLTWVVGDSQSAEPEFMIYLSDLRESHGNQLGRLTILSNMLYSHPEMTSKSVMERYFPKVYFPIFEKHSKGLDPYLLMALARRESAFNTKAISRARAKGLMQIAPQTQRRLSSLKNMFDPEVNISIGSRYLSDLLKRTNGQIHLALASYNAGPNRVDLWSARYPMSDPILFVDLIPYKETREYVASVLRNYYWYRRLHTDSSPSKPSELLQLTP